MSKEITVKALVDKTLSGLKAAGYSLSSLNGFRQKYDGLLSFCVDKKIVRYTESVGEQYLVYIDQTRVIHTKAENMAFLRMIARLNCALNDLPWRPAKRKIGSYEKSVFDDIVNGYEAYLTEKKTSKIHFIASIVERFLRQVTM